MNDIEQKALALVKEVAEHDCYEIDDARFSDVCAALCRAIEQHEAYKQKVNDIASAYNQMAFTVTEPHLSGYRVIIGFDKHADASVFHDRLVSLLDFLNPKPKPDPLREIAEAWGLHNTVAKSWVEDLRATLEARGLEIREKNDD